MTEVAAGGDGERPRKTRNLAKLAVRLSIGAALLGIVFGDYAFESWIAARPGSSEFWRLLPGTMILALLAAGGALETGRLLRAMGIPCHSRWCALGGGLHILALLPWPGLPTGAGVPIAYGLLSIWLTAPLFSVVLRERDLDQARSLAGNAAALAYVPLQLGFLAHIHAFEPDGVTLLLAVIVATKSSDIFAYLTGWSIGRHKAIPWLSPGKTWEGFAGGALGCLIVSMAFFCRLLPLPAAVALGVLLAVLAPLGDLVESLLKRRANLKDSGQLLPEFGGVLDMVDSLLPVAAPAFVLLALFRL